MIGGYLKIGGDLKSWMRRFIRMSLEAQPLCLLFSLFNFALLVGKDANSTFSWLVVAAICVAAALALGFLFSLIPGRGQPIAITFLRALFVVFFVATVFFPQGGALQDGSQTPLPSWQERWPLYAVYVLAIIATAAAGYIWRDQLKRVFLASVILSVGFILYTAGGALLLASPGVLSGHTDMTYAKGRNVVIVLADMLQGSTVEQTFNFHPELKAEFPGFTAYTRAISPFPFTAFSMPAILSGKTYASSNPSPKFAENMQAAKENSFITDARAKGYPEIIVGTKMVVLDAHQQMYSPSDEQQLLFVRNAIDLGFVRVFSYRFLASLFNVETSLPELFHAKSESLRLSRRMAREAIGRDQNKIFLIHNFVPHAPTATYDETGYARSASGDQDLAYLGETSLFLKSMGQIVSQLKTLGLYDEALVIITGDHGHFEGARQSLLQNYPGAEDLNRPTNSVWARGAKMYNPAILVKPPHATGALSISRAPASITHIRAMVDAGLNKKSFSPDQVLADAFATTQDMDVVVFTNDVQDAPPYQSAKSHVVIKSEGNASTLIDLLSDHDHAPFSYPAYQLGSTIPASTYLGGEHSRNAQGAWIQDSAVYLSLTLKEMPEEADGFTLNLSGTPLVSKDHAQQRLRFSANGMDLGTLSFTKSSETKSLDIPRSAFDGDKLLLVIEPLDAASPKSLGLYDYGFDVSVLLHSFSLSADAS